MFGAERGDVGVQIAAGERGLDQEVMKTQVVYRDNARCIEGEAAHTLVVHVVAQLVEGKAPSRVERRRLHHLVAAPDLGGHFLAGQTHQAQIA